MSRGTVKLLIVCGVLLLIYGVVFAYSNRGWGYAGYGGRRYDNGTYGGCNPDCSAAPRCGDASVQAGFGEQCDDGVNDGTYATCNPGCTNAPTCGDSNVDVPQESCDNGVNDGSYGTCNPDCTAAPACGDATVNAVCAVMV